MNNDTRTPTPQPVPAETVRLMEAWATVAGPDHVWAGNEPHPWIEDIEGGCAVQGCIVNRVDHYVPPGLHLSCLGCGTPGLEGPTYCATHGDWLCERCVAAIRSAEARDATGPDADDAECGCGAIGVAYHTNAQHYGTRANAEARDVSGLREWQHAVAGCRCPERPNCLPHGSDGVHQWLDLCDLPHEHTDSPADRTVAAFRQRDRAALEAAPPEPRWPSRDELAQALHDKDYRVLDRADPEHHQHPAPSEYLDDADDILAALREGGERP